VADVSWEANEGENRRSSQGEDALFGQAVIQQSNHDFKFGYLELLFQGTCGPERKVDRADHRQTSNPWERRSHTDYGLGKVMASF
jgi:hypothetical protein